MWWDGVVPESGQPVLPGDATDGPGDAVRESSNPVDVSDVSVDLLSQIRQGYEADPKYRTASTLQPGTHFDSRITKDENTVLSMYLGKRVCVPKGGALKRAILYELHDSPT